MKKDASATTGMHQEVPGLMVTNCLGWIPRDNEVLRDVPKNDLVSSWQVWVPLSPTTMPFDYNYQNPSRFAFLMLIRAIGKEYKCCDGAK